MQVSNSVFNPEHEANVFWNKPDGGDYIDRYQIDWYQYGIYYRSGYKFVKHESHTINFTFTISNLQSGTKYKVVVFAQNSAGYGSYRPVYVTTGN